MVTLPIDFEHRMQQQLGAAYDVFFEKLNEKPPVSIRLNRQKAFPRQWENATPIAWEASALYLPERISFTLDPAFHAGAYYVQEASSMLISYALRQKVDFSRPLRILDLCGAPGGKSTLLASLMSDESVLVANEVIKTRVNILKENINKWGNPNVLVSNHEAEEFTHLDGFFDVILVDAPCSGEGLFRKDENAIKEWSLQNVNLCATRQRKILAHIVDMLSEGGVLLYSTCTYNDDENINNAAWLAKTFQLHSQRIEIPTEWGVGEISKDNTFGYQCYPHKVRGEGFFFSVFQKNGALSNQKDITNAPNTTQRDLTPLTAKETDTLIHWIKAPETLLFYRKGNGTIVAVPKAISGAVGTIDSALRRVSYGVTLGEFKGKDFIPSHDLALSTLISPNIEAIELDKEDALLYLKKELYSVDTDYKGWALARYEGLNLGFMKVLPNRINNYLPTNFRIRMDL